MTTARYTSLVIRKRKIKFLSKFVVVVGTQYFRHEDALIPSLLHMYNISEIHSQAIPMFYYSTKDGPIRVRSEMMMYATVERK